MGADDEFNTQSLKMAVSSWIDQARNVKELHKQE
jgi:hypothetical protein